MYENQSFITISSDKIQVFHYVKWSTFTKRKCILFGICDLYSYRDNRDND